MVRGKDFDGGPGADEDVDSWVKDHVPFHARFV